VRSAPRHLGVNSTPLSRDRVTTTRSSRLVRPLREGHTNQTRPPASLARSPQLLERQVIATARGAGSSPRCSVRYSPRNGTTAAVDVGSSTTYEDRGVTSPTFANGTRGEVVAVESTTASRRVTATSVFIGSVASSTSTGLVREPSISRVKPCDVSWR
jgi:hypothetical protein